MCNRCDNKVVGKRWVVWITIAVTVLMFASSQIYMYGKAIGILEEHIKTAPTNKAISQEYVDKDEFSIIKI